jgi:hypothetical protein
MKTTVDIGNGQVATLANHPVESIDQVLVDGQPVRPTPEQIDELAREYEAAKLHIAEEKENLSQVEERCILLVQAWGTVPAHAEKSRRLAGKLSEMLVTRADTLTVVDERVGTLKEALEANGYGEYFKKLFTLRSKYEVVEGAETALKSESLPKRLSEKVLNLWGRCITVRGKKPSLKVTLIDPAKPAKKAKKAAL